MPLQAIARKRDRVERAGDLMPALRRDVWYDFASRGCSTGAVAENYRMSRRHVVDLMFAGLLPLLGMTDTWGRIRKPIDRERL